MYEDQLGHVGPRAALFFRNADHSLGRRRWTLVGFRRSLLGSFGELGLVSDLFFFQNSHSSVSRRAKTCAMSEDSQAQAKKARAEKLIQVMQELKVEYLEKFPQKIALLKRLTEAKDYVGLESEYHKLKGTGKTYGFPEVSTVCEKLERLSIEKFPQKLAIFDEAILFLEKLNRIYQKQGSLELAQDAFMRSLLDLTEK